MIRRLRTSKSSFDLDQLFGNKASKAEKKRRRRQRRRQLQMEPLEERALLAGFELLSIQPNAQELLNQDDVRNVGFTELTFRFTEGTDLDPTSLADGIQILRSGGDDDFSNGSVVITPNFIGLGEMTSEVVVRFAETLPDDLYRIQVFGTGPTPLKDTTGVTFDNVSVTPVIDDLQLDFELNLGPQIVAVVPQPVTRLADGSLQQAKNQIVVYFNDDDLQDGPLNAENPAFYKLILTQDTVRNTDDTEFIPTDVDYDPATDRATLTFAMDLDLLGGGGSERTYRLRIGNDESAPPAPNRTNVSGGSTDAADSAGSSFTTSFNVGTLGAQSQILTSEIDPRDFPLEFPGATDEPGHREILVEDHFGAGVGPDANGGVETIEYNFQSNLGILPNGQVAKNVINAEQKERAREVFSIYSYYLGVQFKETTASGWTIGTGDLRVIDPDITTGPGGVIGLAGGGIAIMDNAENWDDGFGYANAPGKQSWFVTAMHEIGHLLGLGHTYDLPPGTIMGDEPILRLTNATEPVFPGDHDILHGQYLHRPESNDIDMYKFTLTQDGVFSAETFAERLPDSSLLDTHIILYDANGNILGRNDDYYSEDSFLEMKLGPGTYYVGVSASGNDDYDPDVTESGFGGRSQGTYDLRLNFRADVDNTIRDTGALTNLGDPDEAPQALDGDADGVPGGVYNFWFRTQDAAHTFFVDKIAPDGGDGSIGSPFNQIDQALADAGFQAMAANDRVILRIVGNEGALNDPDQIPVPYQIGRNGSQVLQDGAAFEVPKNVTVMIDEGAVFKLLESRIGVGSSSANVDRSASALQVLGTPDNSVFFTSYNDPDLGGNTNPIKNAGESGEWGGLRFRNDFDNDANRFNYEDQGIFLNYVNHADLRFGGGDVPIGSLRPVVAPISMIESRPTISFNKITESADAAIGADPNSFLETNFHAPVYQQAGEFTLLYDRVGPEIHGNQITGNSLNGLYLRINTPAGDALRPMTVAGRFDDRDIVHIVNENLVIEGTTGGAVDDTAVPPVTLVVPTEVPLAGSTLAAGTYNYKVVFVDSQGDEGPPSNATSDITIAAGSNIQLSNLPTASGDFVARRIYRSDNTGAGPYTLVQQIPANGTTFVDTGLTAGGQLVDMSTLRPRTDASLVIDPGVIVKMANSRIEVGIGASLIAEGTEGREVIFTSLQDDTYGAGGTGDTRNDGDLSSPAPGDWSSVFARPTSTLSIDHSVLQYGGGISGIGGTAAAFNVIEVHQATARITHSILQDNSSGKGGQADSSRVGYGFNDRAAIFVRGAQPIIVDNIIRDNSGAAVSINVDSLNADFVHDLGRMRGPADIIEDFRDNQGALVRLNRIGNNEINGMRVRSQTLTTESVWDDTDIVHVVDGMIYVPDFHSSGGLRLESSSKESLVVKFTDAAAGITATGRPLDIDDRIGGAVQIVGQPNHDVVLTSINDTSVGAGFDPRGNSQVDTNNTGLIGRSQPPGSFKIDINYGPNILALPQAVAAVNQAVAIWESFIEDPITVTFDFDLSALGPGILGGALSEFAQIDLDTVRQAMINDARPQETLVPQIPDLANLNVTLPNDPLNPYSISTMANITRANALALGFSPAQLPAIVSAYDPTELRDADINFTNDLTLWDFDRSDGINPTQYDFVGTVLHEIGHALGFVSAQDDVDIGQFFGPPPTGPSREIMLNTLDYFRVAPGASRFLNFTDTPRILDPSGVSVFYDGGFFDPVGIPIGGLQLGDVPLSTGAFTGDGNQASHWKDDLQIAGIMLGMMDPTGTPGQIDNITNVDLRAFDYIGWNTVSGGANPGDWAGIKIDQFSGDRNIDVVVESESLSADPPGTNATTEDAQFIGAIATDEYSGDENLRLGFDVNGFLDGENDVDVYSFDAQVGTEVWFDVDRTESSLDSVIELLDNDGNVIATSDNSRLNDQTASLAGTQVNGLGKSDFYRIDNYTLNPRDAGMRVVLPGAEGSTDTYHLRIRSDGETEGGYKIQLRLRETQEVPGSMFRFADIRYATNGVQVSGMPGHSPLLGEAGDVEFNGGDNDDTTTAQDLGNVLNTDRGALGIGGFIEDLTDVDFYQFEVRYDSTQGLAPVPVQYAGTIFDVDYADGFARPDITLFVFDADGNLVLTSRDSNIAEDLFGPLAGAETDDLSRGSAGPLDSYIGAVELPEGDYFLAATSDANTAEEMEQFFDANADNPLLRLEPVNSVLRIAEDHIGDDGQGTADAPVVPVLLDEQSAVPFHLGDVTLFVSTGGSRRISQLYTVDPFTGAQETWVGQFSEGVGDITFRREFLANGAFVGDGTLVAYSQDTTDAASGNLIAIDPGGNGGPPDVFHTTSFSLIGDDGLITYDDNPAMAGVNIRNANSGVQFEAIAITPDAEVGFAAGFRDGNINLVPTTDNLLYVFNPQTGAALGLPIRTGNNRLTGGSTNFTERAEIVTDTATLDAVDVTVITSSDPSPTSTFSQILDGTTFSVASSTQPVSGTFEFDLGTTAIVDIDPRAVPTSGVQRTIRDGDFFILEVDNLTNNNPPVQRIFQFDTGWTVDIDRLLGTTDSLTDPLSGIRDGDTIAITSMIGTPPVPATVVVEFNDTSLGNGFNPANLEIPYDSTTDTKQDLINSLLSVVNPTTLPGFGVNAVQLDGTGRVTFDGASDVVVNAQLQDGVQFVGAGGPAQLLSTPSGGLNVNDGETLTVTDAFGSAVFEFDRGDGVIANPNEQQKLEITGGMPGDKFDLTLHLFGGTNVTISGIDYNADAATLQGLINTALGGGVVPGYSPDDLAVSGLTVDDPGFGLTLTYTGSLSQQNHGQFTVDTSGFSEKQRLLITGGVAGDTFDLTLHLSGGDVTITGIDYNADSATLQGLINTALGGGVVPGYAPNDLLVTGLTVDDPGNGLTLAYTGSLSSQDPALLTVDTSGFSGIADTSGIATLPSADTTGISTITNANTIVSITPFSPRAVVSNALADAINAASFVNNDFNVEARYQGDAARQGAFMILAGNTVTSTASGTLPMSAQTIVTPPIDVNESDDAATIAAAISTELNDLSVAPAPTILNVDASNDGARIGIREQFPDVNTVNQRVTLDVDFGGTGAPGDPRIQAETDNLFANESATGVRPGRIPVPIDVSTNAAGLASAMAAAINANLNPPITATSGGGTVNMRNVILNADFPLTIGTAGTGGDITGLAIVDNVLYAVDDGGQLYSIDVAMNTLNAAQRSIATITPVGSPLISPITGAPIQFSGLTVGPQTVENGAYARTLFGLDDFGNVYAFNTDGVFQPIFTDGAVGVTTGLAGADGLAFSTHETNLWHVTDDRMSDVGHGVNEIFDGSREAVEGGNSFYFGRDDDAGADLNLPGGTHGVAESHSFSLKGYSRADLPMLYFNYFIETEGFNGTTMTGMRDSFRVYVSSEDTPWVLLATNNSARGPQLADDEYDDQPVNGNLVDIDTQELFDYTPNDANQSWRQARIPLVDFAGDENVRIRFEYSSAGDMNLGDIFTTGSEMRLPDGEALRDQQVFTLTDTTNTAGPRTTFEFDLGPTLVTPTGAALSDTSTFTIDGVTFEFDKPSAPGVTFGNVAVPVSDFDSASDVAAAIENAIFGSSLLLTPYRFDDRVNLAGVTSASSSSAVVVEGADGTVTAGAIPVEISPDMTGAQIATIIADLMEQQYGAAGSTAPPVLGSLAEGALRNDVLLTAVDSGITFANRTEHIYTGNIGDNPTLTGADAPSDVDLLKFDLSGGITLDIRVDAQAIGSSLDSILRVFDSSGAQLRVNDDFNGRDPFISFTAPADGTYYVGVSAYSNFGYLPTLEGSGFGSVGNTGDYELHLSYGTGGLVRTASKLNDDTIQLIGHAYDFTLSNAPLVLTTQLWGDAIAGASLQDSFNDSHRGVDNAVDGVYVDDLIIGFAERGEMATAAAANAGFVANPNVDEQAVLEGGYHVEIRRAPEYAVPFDPEPAMLPTLQLLETLDPNDRMAKDFTIFAPFGYDLTDGQQFTIGDGLNQVTYEFDDLALDNGVAAGNFEINFSTSDTDYEVAAAIREAINAPDSQNRIEIRALLGDGADSGQLSTSNRVNLFGNSIVRGNIPSQGPIEVFAILPTFPYVFDETYDFGDPNRFRDQGQIIIDSTKISQSSGVGVLLDAGDRDRPDLVPLAGELAHAGTPLSGPQLNLERWVPGTVLVNSIVSFNTGGAVRIEGDPNLNNSALAAVPFARLINNTLYGLANGDVGVDVFNNASPSLLNNVVSNFTNGIRVDASSSSTVVEGTVYKNNGTDATGVAAGLGDFAITLGPDDPLFVNPDVGNFIPADGSRIIDSSVASVDERDERLGLLSLLGIGTSPILAPELDVNGQVRTDDPAVNPPSGSGFDPFKDRGAVDRADFIGPTAVVVVPPDNDPAVDRDPEANQVNVGASVPVSFFGIQLVDGVDPANPLDGSGIDDNSVVSSRVKVFFEGNLLVDRVDYNFSYDRTNNVIRISSTAGLFSPGLYTVVLDNSKDQRVINAPNGAGLVEGDTITIADNFGGTAVLEFVSGLTLNIPTMPLPGPGETFTLSDGVTTQTFEFTNNGLVLPGNIAIDLTLTPTIDVIAANTVTAIESSALTGITPTNLGGGRIHLGGGPQTTFSNTAGSSGPGSSVIVTGQVAPQTPGAIPVSYIPSPIFTAPEVAQNIAAAIQSAGLTNVLVSVNGSQVVLLNVSSIVSNGLDGFLSPIADNTGNELLPNKADGSTSFTIVVGIPDSDFGDAPDPYPTQLGEGGAFHPVGALFLGSSVDIEPNGVDDLSTDNSLGDNANGVDEDGVTPVGLFATGSATFNVVSSGAGKLDAWIDLDNNGVWDASEQIFVSVNVGLGTNALPYAVPNVPEGDYWARFRLSTDGGLLPTGGAEDGEVEDYLLHIGPPSPFQNNNPSQDPNDVNADGTVNFADILVLITDLRANGFRSVSAPPPITPPPYLDPNGDNFINFLDVLSVLTFLRNGGSPEGEGGSQPEGEASSAIGTTTTLQQSSLQESAAAGETTLQQTTVVSSDVMLAPVTSPSPTPTTSTSSTAYFSTTSLASTSLQSAPQTTFSRDRSSRQVISPTSSNIAPTSSATTADLKSALATTSFDASASFNSLEDDPADDNSDTQYVQARVATRIEEEDRLLDDTDPWDEEFESALDDIADDVTDGWNSEEAVDSVFSDLSAEYVGPLDNEDNG